MEAQVDEAVELWGITDRELKEIRRSLEALSRAACTQKAANWVEEEGGWQD